MGSRAHVYGCELMSIIVDPAVHETPGILNMSSILFLQVGIGSMWVSFLRTRIDDAQKHNTRYIIDRLFLLQ